MPCLWRPGNAATRPRGCFVPGGSWGLGFRIYGRSRAQVLSVVAWVFGVPMTGVVPGPYSVLRQRSSYPELFGLKQVRNTAFDFLI